jgi:hypothetical protein
MSLVLAQRTCVKLSSHCKSVDSAGFNVAFFAFANSFTDEGHYSLFVVFTEDKYCKYSKTA